MKTDDILKLALEELDVSFSTNQIDSIKEYLSIVYEYNKSFNLIGSKDKESILIRHILDSISLLGYWNKIFIGRNKDNKILDVGTGAGLPGIPLSIFLSNKLFYLLDDSLKKINFLKMVVSELKIRNVMIIRGRAEKLARENKYREDFDIVLARAVTKFNILSELAIPFCRISGKMIFYKSKKVAVELRDNKDAILKLGGKVENLFDIKVPYLDEYRTFLVVKKVKKSPEMYPRSFSKIKKKPL